MFKFLKGYRTHICAIALIIVQGLFAQHYIGAVLHENLMALFGAGGLMALRAAVNK